MSNPLIPAALFAIAVALGSPAIAAAEEVFDVEKYDECMKKTVRNADFCCLDAGGTPTSDPNDTQPDGSPNCYAPPAEAQGAAGEPGVPPRLPPGVIVGDMPTAVLEPASPANPAPPWTVAPPAGAAG
ncbi:hypothetical protein [Mycobacterium hubeiense]|uniref:hypothetical protein n=1 Tax=Mycobacterium hubeiense TaxID=1867256 RepID=UPI00115C0B0E|nr:hypothetical protein [Mycobacterium sp. QGD 101]